MGKMWNEIVAPLSVVGRFDDIESSFHRGDGVSTVRGTRERATRSRTQLKQMGKMWNEIAAPLPAVGRSDDVESSFHRGIGGLRGAGNANTLPEIKRN